MDKILHFLAGIVTVMFGWTAHAANGQGDHVLAGLMLLGAMAAISREAYNWHDGGRWCLAGCGGDDGRGGRGCGGAGDGRILLTAKMACRRKPQNRSPGRYLK